MAAEILGEVVFALSQYYDALVTFLAWTWWFWIFVVLLPVLHSTWMHWRHLIWDKKDKYTMLELSIPREIEKNPRGMEQVLKAIHTLRNAAGDLEEKYWDGEKTRTFTFELTSVGGEIHFYVRVPQKYTAIVQAAFFSYYPDVEVAEVEDPVKDMPETPDDIKAQGNIMWGSEMLMRRAGPYPIKTYRDFEVPSEELEFDPISTTIEILGKVRPGEFVGIQFVAAPAPPDWVKNHTKELADLKRWKKDSEGKMGEFSFAMMMPKSPGETDVLKAVENHLSKPAFDTVIRFIYISPKTMFYDSFPRRGIWSAFNQYGSLDLNTFVHNMQMWTRAKIWNWPYVFPKTRARLRAQRLYHYYRERENPTETFMGRFLSSHPLNWNVHSKTIEFNTEEMATLFHPPMRVVLTAPHIKRVESRKAGPPAGLNIFADEKVLDEFQQ
ncbi:MAG: hypothetical protein HYZ07_00830 [Candidatus Harrisonbacteria bacterium]|nr:hypothetical protein [Candidatus Harrisonbacteria bacterium]MBI2604101.1 hypothetical protein [Candidatus Harrisonbacteria bacterium]MBI3114487.1 hypothetical protein [Candidatus Harrisonbacteria bacterium]